MRSVIAAALLGLLAAAPAGARSVGTVLTDVELDGFSQTEAKAFSDYVGRTVLVEFFAFW